VPRIIAAQAADRSGTVASAIRIAEPVHREQAEETVARAEGSIVTVTDDEILAAWRELAHEEGVFCEPSSAAGVAALAKLPHIAGSRVVSLITGHGLKDPRVVEESTEPPIQVDPDPDAIAAAAARSR
jgi:threonine synthase